MRSRTNSGDSLRRQSRHPKLHHSRSDDNRRRSFDKHSKDSQSSRHSLNTQAVMESSTSDFEPKYFTTVSLETEESRCDNSDDSHVVDIEDINPGTLTPEAPMEEDMLIEEPELENVTEIDVESSGDDLEDDDGKCISSRTGDTLQEPGSTIIAENQDLEIIVIDNQVERHIDNTKCETTLYTEDDEA